MLDPSEDISQSYFTACQSGKQMSQYVVGQPLNEPTVSDGSGREKKKCEAKPPKEKIKMKDNK